jgi:hypothetical protein
MATVAPATETALQTKQLENKAIISAEKAKALVVKTSEQYLEATEFLKGIVVLTKEITNTFKPMKEAAHRAHQEVVKQETKLLAPLKEADMILRRLMQGFNTEQERARTAEQQRLEAIEKQRRDEAAVQEAQRLQEAGRNEQAQQVIEQAVEAPAAVVILDKQEFVPKVQGVSTRKGKWKGRVIDESKVPDQFWVLDQKIIDRYADTFKGMAKAEGIEFYQEDAAISVRV